MPLGRDSLVLCVWLFALLRTGFAFRCHVCTSEDDESCETMPRHSSHCKFVATGCLKLVNYVTDYDFVDKHGSKLKLDDWDGSESGWEAVPYVRTIVTRRCTNDHSRYRVKRGCHGLPFVEKAGKTRGNDVVCYCETELCNASTKSGGNCATLCIALPIVRAIFSIR